VVYLQAAVDLRGLPPHLWKFLPRYSDAFSKLGAAGQTWEQVAARRATVTGRLGSYFTAQLHAESGAPVVDLRFELKTLDSDVDAALDLFTDLVFGLEPGDRARLHDMQRRGVAYYRSRLINDALGAAMVTAARSQTSVSWLNYLWNSPLTYAWMSHLTENFDAHAVELIEGVEAVRDFLRNGARWTWSFTGSDEAFARTQASLSEWRARMSEEDISSTPLLPGTQHWDGAGKSPSLLGLAAPLDVQFCASAFPAPARDIAPLVDLGFSRLQFDYFMPEIRFKGNAYGGGGGLDLAEGIATFYSYRDPLLNETLSVFEGAAAWTQAQAWTPDDLERALLGNVRDAVPAIRPANGTYQSLDRLRRGESAVRRARDYQQKLNATPEAVQSALLNYLAEAWPRATTAVAASRAALERANAHRSEERMPSLVIEEMLHSETL
jgi:Zn-dependent M16 (insulinase) family peptidase